MGVYRVDGKPIDPAMSGFLKNEEWGDQLVHDMFKVSDQRHYTDKNRTKFGDMKIAIDKLVKKMEIRGEEEGWLEQKDLRQVVHFLEQNYKSIDDQILNEEDAHTKVKAHLENYKRELEEYEQAVLSQS